MRFRILCLATLLVACAKSPERAVAPESEMVHASVADDGQSPTEPTRAFDARKLIRTVHLHLRVDDTQAVSERIQALAGEVSGYVASASADRREQLLYYRITIKVPVDRLEPVLDEIRAMAVEVLSEKLETEDVTDRFVDLEARLRTLRATETELQALLAESRSREQKAEDIMAIYRHLTEIRTRIEQHQAQLNTLTQLTAYSTVHLTLTPTEAAKPLVGDRWRPSETVRGSFRTLLGALRGLADFAIFLVIVLLPVGVLVAIPVWPLVKLWRRRRQREG